MFFSTIIISKCQYFFKSNFDFKELFTKQLKEIFDFFNKNNEFLYKFIV